jgi:hypothetical protein
VRCCVTAKNTSLAPRRSTSQPLCSQCLDDGNRWHGVPSCKVPSAVRPRSHPLSLCIHKVVQRAVDRLSE